MDNEQENNLLKDNPSTFIDIKDMGTGGLSSMLGINSGSQLLTLNSVEKSKYFLPKASFSKEFFQ